MRFLTAGESHGPCLAVIIEGFPAGLAVSAGDLNRELARRQQGYGRGSRMAIERDEVELLSGVRYGQTIGSPIALLIKNRDFSNWREVMEPAAPFAEKKRIAVPRPGHADLAGGLKYNRRDLRDVLERASARETAARVAAGALAKLLLKEFDIMVASRVTAIGGVEAAPWTGDFGEGMLAVEQSPLRTTDRSAETTWTEQIDQARKAGDSLGGLFEIEVRGLPVGLGSYSQWDRRLDGRLAGVLMSIPGIKGVEIGDGFALAAKKGTAAHDPIVYGEGLFRRTANHAGGLEGGMTNGEPLILRAAMKPIPTLRSPLPSIDIDTKQIVSASVERADVCAVPAASVVGEAVVAWELARALAEKFGGDSLEEMKRNYKGYMEQINRY